VNLYSTQRWQGALWIWGTRWGWGTKMA